MQFSFAKEYYILPCFASFTTSLSLACALPGPEPGASKQDGEKRR